MSLIVWQCSRKSNKLIEEIDTVLAKHVDSLFFFLIIIKIVIYDFFHTHRMVISIYDALKEIEYISSVI